MKDNEIGHGIGCIKFENNDKLLTDKIILINYKSFFANF